MSSGRFDDTTFTTVSFYLVQVNHWNGLRRTWFCENRHHIVENDVEYEPNESD